MSRARPWVRRALIAAVAAAASLATAPEASAQLAALVSPGRLNRAHASLEGVDKCLQCHSKGRGVAAEKCLTCHKPIAQRIAAKKGVHRDVTTDCVACHVEHAGVDAELRPFDPRRFDHKAVTGFAIDGLHAPLASNCASCHKTRSFLTASPSCASCHTDVHKGSLGARCAACHSTAVKFPLAFKNFNHGLTAFPLSGAHATVACESCHKAKRFKGTPFATCASCHTDPHRAKMGANCRSCHTDAGWRTTKVDHARTAFPLRGLHAAVACQKCHVKPATQAKPRSDTCAACHNDPHKGVFKQDCRSCHSETGFRKGKFDHTGVGFPLADGHAGLACTACHKATRPGSNDFRGQTQACASCHADVHRGELGTGCDKCHSPKSFEVKAFTHANQRAFFAGQHSSIACAQCHSATLKPARTASNVPAVRVGFTTTPTACAGCHADVHLGQVKAACESCHSIEAPKFAPVGFSHANTKFPLTGQHAPVACGRCHIVETGAFPAGRGTARRLNGFGTSCVTCHTDPHAGQFEETCQTCHSADAFKLPYYVHRRESARKDFFKGRHRVALCSECHTPMPARAAGAKPVTRYAIETTCTACHKDVHRGSLGPDCGSCHKP